MRAQRVLINMKNRIFTLLSIMSNI